MLTKILPLRILTTVAVLGLCAGVATAETAPAAGAAPKMEAHALDLLKRAADKISATRAFTVQTDGSVEMAAPTGQTLTLFAKGKVAVQRPNKLAAVINGETRTMEIYYDGAQLTSFAPEHGLYAQTAAPASLDELMPFIFEKVGVVFPFEEFLYKDVYADMTKNMTSAFTVGPALVNGIACEHLAFAGPDVEWEIWLGPADRPLPRRLTATFVNLPRRPHFVVDYTNWQLLSGLSENRFVFKKPADAQRVEFRPMSDASKP